MNAMFSSFSTDIRTVLFALWTEDLTTDTLVMAKTTKRTNGIIIIRK